MNAFAKLAMAAAAVLVVAVVGINLVPGSGPGGSVTPTPTPTLSAAPIVSPSPSATAPALPVGDIEAGRYAWTWPVGRIALTVPTGWTARSDGSIVRRADTPAEIGLAHWLPGLSTEVSQVYDEACIAGETLVEIGPTTADLVAVLEAQGGTTATVTELEIGGLPATRIDMTVEAGLDPATCRNAPDGPIQVWFQEQAGFLALFPASDDRYGHVSIWSVDVDGERAIFTSGWNGDSEPSDIAEIEEMVRSIAFE